MKSSLPENIILYQHILSEKQKSSVEEILDEINRNIETYSTDLIWEVDKEIGGIGGYCMPCNPIINPYPGGEYRQLFRPLQYARSEIDIANVHMSSRYIVFYSGLHLETVVRLVLAKIKILGNLKYMNTTLGRATKKLQKSGGIPDELIEGLFHFVPIYNKSKHEVNQDEDRKRLFMPSDAIIAYLSARILGFQLLKIINHDSTKYNYEIDKSKFKGHI